MNEVKTEVKAEVAGAHVCADCKSCSSNCSPMHWSCCIVPILTLVFWGAGVIALVLAWIAGDGQIWGKADAFWYLNAITLGVLAIGGKGKKWGMCRTSNCCMGGSCGGGSCK